MENNGNSIAKISLGINIALIIAVIILFVKLPSGDHSSETANSSGKADTTVSEDNIPDDGILKIGYFNADSLNNNLLIMKDVEAELEKATKNAERKMQSKQRELDAWQQKWKNRGQLFSKEQAQFQKEAQERQQDAMMYEQQVQMELSAKQEEVMLGHINRISNFSKIYARENGYDMIFSYQLGQNIFYGSPNLDVTDGLVKLMNEDYNDTFSSAEKSNEEVEEETAEG